MPSFKITVDPLGHRQNLIERAVLRRAAEFQRNQVADNAGIESVAGESDTFRAENAIRALTIPWSDTQKRKVTCTTAEVADKNQFVMIKFAFIKVRCCHRFVFE